MWLGFRKGNVAGALSVCPSVSGRLGPVRDWTWTVPHLASHATSLICLCELCVHTTNTCSESIRPSYQTGLDRTVALEPLASHATSLICLGELCAHTHTTNTCSESICPSYQIGLDRIDILHHTTSVRLISMQYVNVAMQYVYILQAHIHHKQCSTWMWQVI